MAGWFAATGLASEAPHALVGGELTVNLWLGRLPVPAELKEAAP
ncbi:MAG: hypothetical protein ACLPG5_11570 [Acidocella sp.]